MEYIDTDDPLNRWNDVKNKTIRYVDVLVHISTRIFDSFRFSHFRMFSLFSRYLINSISFQTNNNRT